MCEHLNFILHAISLLCDLHSFDIIIHFYGFTDKNHTTLLQYNTNPIIYQYLFSCCVNMLTYNFLRAFPFISLILLTTAVV